MEPTPDTDIQPLPVNEQLVAVVPELTGEPENQSQGRLDEEIEACVTDGREEEQQTSDPVWNLTPVSRAEGAHLCEHTPQIFDLSTYINSFLMYYFSDVLSVFL